MTVSAPTTGRWSYRVEGWSDPYGTWHHDAAIKIAADVDTEMMLEEGARVLERAIAEVPRTPEQAGRAHRRDLQAPGSSSHSAGNRLGAGVSHAVEAELAARPLRDYVTPSPDYPWLVERERALYGAWYEFFPRSEGCELDETTGLWKSGTFATAAERLPAVAGDGFRRHLPDPDAPDRHDQPQGPQQHADRRRARPRARRTRSARRTAAMTPSIPSSATSTISMPSSPARRNSAWRSRSTWRCSARPTIPG